MARPIPSMIGRGCLSAPVNKKRVERDAGKGSLITSIRSSLSVVLIVSNWKEFLTESKVAVLEFGIPYLV